jgi:hypothetical protein
VRLFSSRRGLVQAGQDMVWRMLMVLAVAAGATGAQAQGMPAEAASAASGVEMTTFEAMATAKFETLAGGDTTEVTPLLHSDGVWATALTIFRGLPWWAGVLLGVILAGAIAWVWRQWQLRSQAWQAELDALGERTPGAVAGSGSPWRKDTRVAGWRLSRFEELPQFWEDTVVMERDEAYELDEDSPNQRQRRWGRRANRVPRNRWATTVTPRGI